jgi:hypothetical protein
MNPRVPVLRAPTRDTSCVGDLLIEPAPTDQRQRSVDAWAS